MDVTTVTGLIIAVTGAVTAVGAVLAGRRGSRLQERNQSAAQVFQERVQRFAEVESYANRMREDNERLLAANDALRDRLAECDEAWAQRFARRDARCVEALGNMSAAFARLQAGLSPADVVLAERAKHRANEHVVDDH